MDKPIIEVKNLGKRYLIGERQPYLALRDSMAEFLKKPLRLFQKHEPSHAGQNEFWALKDVDFEVNKGDTVGIIGRNGAGKSTLLKILSQITPPTTGTIHLRGRMASLLEVGTGFHPELTGRENIYLNGALLGMKKWEIKQKFDQIIEFADISKFLDTPVKRYSSGMYVRLAFSVAAHLEPDILVVDEVLAVGDSEFQKKCLGKMGEVTSKEGRTILFVSHNMQAVQSLCKTCILIDKGKIIASGPSAKIIEKYLNTRADGHKTPVGDRKDRRGKGTVKITDFWLEDENHEILTNVAQDRQITFCIKINNFSETKGNVALGIYNSSNQCMLWLDSTSSAKYLSLKNGTNVIKCALSKELALAAGSYAMNIAIFDEFRGEILDYVANVEDLNITHGDFYHNGIPAGGSPAIFVKQDWEISK
jgi:lipopolysaccharide transport system ATP-binding protein